MAIEQPDENFVSPHLDRSVNAFPRLQSSATNEATIMFRGRHESGELRAEESAQFACVRRRYVVLCRVKWQLGGGSLEHDP